jgi:ferritin
MEKKLLNLFQAQIKNELESAYKYLGMSAFFETTAFKGFAEWMRAQTKEEIEHSIKLFDYINDRGHRVELLPIASMPTQYNSPLEVFQAALAHEQFVTRLINEMYGVAIEVRDYAAQTFLQWYIDEQVEEEKQVQDILDRMEISGNSISSLLALDRMLSQRK